MLVAAVLVLPLTAGTSGTPTPESPEPTATPTATATPLPTRDPTVAPTAAPTPEPTVTSAPTDTSAGPAEVPADATADPPAESIAGPQPTADALQATDPAPTTDPLPSAGPSVAADSPSVLVPAARVRVTLGAGPRRLVTPDVVTRVRVKTRPAVDEGTRVALQTRRPGQRWADEAVGLADAAGSSVLALRPGRGTWRYRVLVRTDPTSVSSVKRIRVGWPKKRLRLSGDARVKGSQKATVTARYNRPGTTRLILQAKRAGTRAWKRQGAQATTRVNGHLSRTTYTVRLPRGRWLLRVVTAPKEPGRQLRSRAHRLAVASGRLARPPRFSSSVSAVSSSQVRYSHRPGCPVPVSQLRNLDVRYVDFGGRVRTGRVVVRASAVDDVRAVFRNAFAQRFPFKVVRPLEAYYGAGSRSPHDSDVAAMNAGNTGAFNCRPVVGNPYRTSQHSYGNAIDYNTIQNPYVTASRVYPAAGRPYLDRSTYRPGMILPGSVVASTMAGRGWPWGARWSYPDYQHFSANGG